MQNHKERVFDYFAIPMEVPEGFLPPCDGLGFDRKSTSWSANSCTRRFFRSNSSLSHQTLEFLSLSFSQAVIVEVNRFSTLSIICFLLKVSSLTTAISNSISSNRCTGSSTSSNRRTAIWLSAILFG